ncbi:MAG: hypothetical protein FRX49_03568 [Trebouxia sp. A1-2]|nr:MAG: hypothetical protein FRX49_03568 [Trebouxia sp. A1-2]
MSALMHTAPLPSLRDFAAPLQQQPSRLCRRQLHRRPVSARHVAPVCHACTKSSRRDVRASARAVAENPVAPEVKAGQKTNWYAVVASAEFMLHDVQNEAFAEQLRERRRLLLERDTDVNFFLVSEPAWLDEKFPDKAKQLRLDRVLKLELGEATPEEALKSLAPVPDFKPLNQTVKNYTAPYPPYKPGWWQQFEPKE